MRTYYDHDEDPNFEDVLDGVYGYWRRDNTPEGQGRWFFTPDMIEGENSSERIRRVTREFARSDTPDQKRQDMFLSAGRWLQDNPDEAPVLRVRCNARSESGRRCRSCVAKVYKTPHGYLLNDALCYPFHESRVADMSLAMAARENGHPLLEPLAQMSQMVAEENIALPIASNLSNPTVTVDMGDGVPRLVFGCEHHGNTAVAVATLLDAARANARSGKVTRDLEINPQDGPIHK